MNSRFATKAPEPLWHGSAGAWRTQLGRIFRSIPRIVWQAFTPFDPQPKAPQPLPPQTSVPDDAQVAQCQWIFDQAELRRTHLEQKAQSTFVLIVFLVPLLASIFVFLFREVPYNTTGYMFSVVFLFVSATLLLLGFISVIRAVSVQSRETLFLGAVIDLKNGQFRKYNKSFHARGLLYCASMNTAMNDHIAQFVKGSRILTAVAVIVLAWLIHDGSDFGLAGVA